MSDKLIDQEINDFYNETSENDRLLYGLGPLEFERNQELITRYLPAQNSVIADIGGGPGIYSQWLANKGHTLHLIDPVAKHIKEAKKKAAAMQNPFQCLLGESRKIDLPDNSVDLVISHGPLYHLLEKSDRIDSLREAKRILKPDGIILGFAINYSASTLVGLIQGLIHDHDFYELCKQELSTSIHIAPANMAGMLPSAYYHKPSQLKKEILSAGFNFLELLPVEGIIWLDNKYFETRSDALRKANMMSLLRNTESDTDLLALSPHLMIAAKNKI
ncbi:MAG: class I SAM-dependent methyltransferase [Bacteroidetes bacterium]|nr:class I SAM-dependent methyltransferase [Bacteroidota bacterium]MBT3748536.1 class I SAM-dependent methyltransferase [Bacteroidota bacterium]MBT4411245.1 class I SAM-dependent methyltransferase [Bacteroidota bacterium]MBT7094894.1 class I SAM-dependent methyltransferase [Bacteroidota bacterium]MBT7465338.1 class I SAM-dependent methyltransferase [Bacteroidota bacterium]